MLKIGKIEFDDYKHPCNIPAINISKQLGNEKYGLTITENEAIIIRDTLDIWLRNLEK